jgi:hypothetical protein
MAAAKQKKRMTTKQMIKDLGQYEYLAEDNTTIITLRALAENEREGALETVFWAVKQLGKAFEESDQDLFIKAHRKISAIVIDLATDKDKAKIVRTWGKYAFIVDLFRILERIGQVEGAMKDDKEPPEQDLADRLMTEAEAAKADQKELEKQGESLPAGEPTRTT